MLAPKKSRFSDTPTLDMDINNGINNNESNSDIDTNIKTNVEELSSVQIQQMMAKVHKEIEERKKMLNVSID